MKNSITWVDANGTWDYGRTMTNQDIAWACEDAADLLDGHWIQGAWWSEATGSMCIEGGIAAALGLEPMDLQDDSNQRDLLHGCPVYDAVVETVNLDIDIRYDDPIGELPNWNDADGRTMDEITDVLRRTAKRVLMPDLY